MRSLRILVLVGLLLGACAEDVGTTTTTQPPETTAPPETTTTPIETTTTTTTGRPELVAATTFFLDDSGGNDARPGPFLIAVHDPAPGSEPLDVLEALLDGPPADATAGGMVSEIPEGTSVVSLVPGADGVATVELSQEFDDGGGSATMFGRLAQLTYTLTGIDGIDAVLLMENGAVVEVFSNEGIVLDGPMVREDFQDLLPGILVESPAWGAPVTLPFEATGTAAAFEAVFQAQLLVDDNAVFDPPFVTSESGVGFADFSFEVDADVVPPTTATLRVWQFSAKDGSVTDERFIPLAIVDD